MKSRSLSLSAFCLCLIAASVVRGQEPSPTATPTATETPTLTPSPTPSPTAVAGAIYASPDGSDTAGDGSRDNPFQSIAKGLAESSAGIETILLPGTYLAGDTNCTGKRLRSEAGASSTIVDGRLSIYSSGPKSTEILTAIEGLTLRGSINRALYVDGGTLMILNCVLRDNYGAGSFGLGGAVLIYDAVVQMLNCRIENNSANGFSDPRTPPVFQFGGGLSINSSRVTLSGCLVRRNLALANNYAFGDGVFAANSSLDIINSTFAENNVSHIYLAGSTASIVNSTFSGNDYVLYGGVATISHSTFVDNTYFATGCQAGATVADSIFVSSPFTFDPQGSCGTGALVSQGHNLSDVPDAGLTAVSDLTGFDPLLIPVFDDRGTTIAFSLAPGSPAIDAGEASSAPATDQLGQPRRCDGNGDGIARVDIGAVEVQGTLCIPTAAAVRDHLLGLAADPTGLDLTGDGVVDGADLMRALLYP